VKPCPSREQLRRLLAVELIGAEYAAVEAHVEDCEICEGTLKQLGFNPLIEGARERLPGDGQASSGEPGGANPERRPAAGRLKQARDRVGELIGKYRLDAYLGGGGMAEVYKATYEPNRSTVALKVIRTELASSPQMVERFKKEMKAVAKLSHPNIVRWHHAGRNKGTFYLAMEFIPGQTLDQRLIAKKKLPWQEVVDLGIGICEGLYHAHWLHIIHRDLKPSNIMITDAGEPKLTDFGIAKDRDMLVSLTAPGSLVGTPAYMAPEQWKVEGVVNHKADLYSLGVVFYQMLTGELPFKADTLAATRDAHLKARPPHPAVQPLHMPKVLDNLVVQLMSKHPDKRPRDAEAVGAVLKWILGELEAGRTLENCWDMEGPGLHPGVWPPETNPFEGAKRKRTPASIRKAALEIGGMIMALLLIGGIIAYILRQPSEAALFAQASKAMASGDTNEVIKIVKELNRVYPSNLYEAITQGWCDKIALETTERRAKALDGSGLLSSPRDSYEKLYKQFSFRAAAMINQFDWEGATYAWDDLANATKPGEARDYLFEDLPVENPWHRLAKNKADELRKETERRREEVSARLAEIQAETDAGQDKRADSLREYMRQVYGLYKDVADLLAPTPPRPEPDPPKAKATATPATETNGSAPSTPDR
jgi:serine/threonine protein kinase